MRNAKEFKLKAALLVEQITAIDPKMGQVVGNWADMMAKGEIFEADALITSQVLADMDLEVFCIMRELILLAMKCC